MSKQANKTMIGAFVLGAIALLVAGVFVFGSGRLFKETRKFVLYFDGSVKGLQIGSAVMFRGVPLGQVTDIAIEVNVENLSSHIPVYIEIDPEKLRVVRGKFPQKKYLYIRGLIEKGLKAQLQLQSFVTGLLVVNLDFYPEKPMRLTGEPSKEYVEIPTVPTDIQELTKMLSELPVREILAKLNSTLAAIEQLANAPHVQSGVKSLNSAFKSLDRILSSPNIDRSLDSLAQVIEKLDRLVAQNENLGYLTGQTLEDVSRMTHSLRSLADYLERHPEALIQGKGAGGGK